MTNPVDRHEQVAVSNADAGYPLLHLQRLLRPGVRQMAVAEDVAHQAINPDIAAGHLAQQRFDNSDTAGNIVGKGFADRANHRSFTHELWASARHAPPIASQWRPAAGGRR
jgi:hypothetical protein